MVTPCLVGNPMQTVTSEKPHAMLKGMMLMDTNLNHVTLTGELTRDPITRFADHGTQQVSFTLRLTETGPAGQAFTLFVPCECYATPAEAAGELTAGEAVLVAGKLKWTSWTAKDGTKRTSLCVLARLVKRLAPAGALAAIAGGPG